ncbi:hypothetical protein HMPREF0650_0958 [Hoylesella buccalis ATCC 35310]|uniref:Uncharacterized protein n=1 Tax=Hoylesella buccalis ATCC 35310 TaxID=679190 RepID=D1W742_9BACT|nr:hypothetical protein HMPREF0650_0958 [Hoylesella buccalis ATCC 35310]
MHVTSLAAPDAVKPQLNLWIDRKTRCTLMMIYFDIEPFYNWRIYHQRCIFSANFYIESFHESF